VVDALVGGDGRRGTAKVDRKERGPQRPALRLVEIEKGVVDVEEDGPETVQRPTWRGR
jgi:hypothetical protein